MARRGKLDEKQARDVVERPARSRKYTYHILIACEDENTEPYYFEKYRKMFEDIWPKQTLYLRPVGTGRNSLGVVKRAIEEREILAREANKATIDRTWAVFDKDDLDKTEGNRRNFIEAFELAKAENVKIAYSNECFELWLLLHLEDVNKENAIPRTEIYNRLGTALKSICGEDFEYDHGNKRVVDLVLEYGDRDAAVQRSEELCSFHSKAEHEPIDSNPNTLVHTLVQELESWLDYYSYD